MLSAPWELAWRTDVLGFDIAADGSAHVRLLGGQTASLAVDNRGNVYVTDPFTSVVRKIGTDGQVSTPVGQAWKYGFAAGDLPGIINRPTGIAVRGSMMYLSVPNAVVQVQLP